MGRMIFGFGLFVFLGFGQTLDLSPAVKGAIERLKLGPEPATTGRLAWLPGHSMFGFLAPKSCVVPLLEVHPPDPEPNAPKIRAQSDDRMPKIPLSPVCQQNEKVTLRQP